MNQESKNKYFTIEDHKIEFYEKIDLSNAGEMSVLIKNDLNKRHSIPDLIDLNTVREIDSAGVAFLDWLKRTLNHSGVQPEITGMKDHVRSKYDLFTTHDKIARKTQHRKTFFETLGKQAMAFYHDVFQKFLFIAADIFFWSIHDLFKKKYYRKGEFVRQSVAIGVNATPIIVAMAFIIGLVLSLQSASQLRNFGANIYIVDLTVIAMMSEMGPLITAILVAGRSGSSIAAEIATMKVTSEIDALKTMGLNPIQFSIVPKMYGSLLTVPLLSILASIAGILGGALTSYIYLDITPEIFFNRMVESLYQKDIITALVKSLFFAVIIVVTGTFYGFTAEHGSEDVGRVTTLSVVVSISLVIIADSILGLIFY